jgi:hypothetical protein
MNNRADFCERTPSFKAYTINEHAKIEAGQPVNLAAIQSYMATVQQYVDLITAVKKGK